MVRIAISWCFKGGGVLLLGGDCGVLLYSRRCVGGRWHRLPISMHPFSRSNFASMSGVSFGLRRPLLFISGVGVEARSRRRTDVELVSGENMVSG